MEGQPCIDIRQTRRVYLIDTTLRDGEQAPGVAFDRQAKLAIARHLDNIGINEIEVGTPAMGPAVQRDIRSIVALNLDCRITAWCRALTDDILAAVACGVPSVHISWPVSDLQLAAINKDRAWVMTQLNTLLPLANSYVDHVSVGAADATRADPRFLARFAVRIHKAGVRRLRLADTVGIARPAVVSRLMASVARAAPGLDLEFHGHNDLGMATANALSALESGAQAVSVTVNGLGERAGNTALEQVAVVLSQHPRLCCDLDLTGLFALCQLVAQASNRPIWPNQPIVGDVVFTHESGIHCHAMLKDARTYEPFAPEKVGRNDRRFILGTHSGTTSIRHLLNRAGLPISQDQAHELKSLLIS
jgi:homocitrate synthase NifV